jgi:hypothetical protein
MAQDNSMKLAVGIIVLLAIIGVVFLLRGGYHYKTASEEQPYGWGGECCTCTRAMQTLQGAVRPETREVLFRNEHVSNCASACAEFHTATKQPGVRYDVNSFISNDPACRTTLPAGRTYAGAGGFYDQPVDDRYYISG